VPGGLPDWLSNLVEPKAASDALGGAGTPETPQYVSPSSNVSNWTNSLFGSDADQEFNDSQDPWNVAVASQVDTGYGLDGNPTSWADQYALTPDQVQAWNNGTIAGTGVVDGDQVLDWAFDHKLF
jgi:hypothetical protein